ncbi:hypothetical protein D3877_28340 [Azospirillum cavernae]|uniref:Class I SAM-dependent methyltransferase n=2 Tax=Azospirillum cavernae TaxID=2320860 RepID=A0A418VKW5_9PROT|nr:hypothetical protein D3877_28340 [Azospirillum cavernae]
MERYIALEAQATAETALPILTAFTPITYHRNGVPVELSSERELIRYVDHNFESEIPGLFKPDARFAPACYVNRFTADEKALVDAVRDHVARMSGRMFGRALRPISNLLVQVAPFRILTELARLAGRSSLSVYEAGPGLGYLGALLAISGHSYASYDVSPALYLWQNRLMREIIGDDFREGALLDAAAPDDPAFTQTRGLHVPWWQHYAMFGVSPRPIDVVYANSNLCEMHLVCARLLMRRALPLLKTSPLGLFVFMSWGFQGQSTAESLHAEFVNEGYRRVQGLSFKAYAPADRDTTAIEQAFAEGIPFYDPTGYGPRLTADDLVALHRAEAPVDVAPAMEYYGWKPPFLD